MKITLRGLRSLLREAHYDIDINSVRDDWMDELDDAIEFVMCQMSVDADAAYGHVVNNWVFDTLEHNDNTFLLARDEVTNDSLAYVPKKGGWNYRLKTNTSCKQKGSQRGYEQKKHDHRSKKTVAPPRPTGTMVSGYLS